jgi:hypothetical protein
MPACEALSAPVQQYPPKGDQIPDTRNCNNRGRRGIGFCSVIESYWGECTSILCHFRQPRRFLPIWRFRTRSKTRDRPALNHANPCILNSIALLIFSLCLLAIHYYMFFSLHHPSSSINHKITNNGSRIGHFPPRLSLPNRDDQPIQNLRGPHPSLRLRHGGGRDPASS